MVISAANYFNNNIQYIQNQLISKPITSHTHEALVERLDEMGYIISKEQEATNPFSQSYLKEIQAKVIHLYGELDSKLWNYRLHQIEREAFLLNNYPSSGNTKRVKVVAEGLKSHIDSLLENYAPALEEKKVISFAHNVLSNLSSTTVPKTTDSQESENEAVEIQEAIEQIIECFTQKDFKKAKFFFERLSTSQKKSLSSILPQDMISQLGHDVKAAANNYSFFLAKG